MRVLFVHSNYGKNALGGEVNVMNHEVQLLRKHGHYVEKFERTNKSSRLGTVVNLLFLWFNPFVFFTMLGTLRKKKFDVIHVHNLWFSVSFAMLVAARLKKVPVVFTLHNYRFICANALFYNKGICTKCLDGRISRVLTEGCSEPVNAFFSYLFLLQLRGTKYYKNYVGVFIVLNDFTAKMAISAGIDNSRIRIKPNSISDSVVPPVKESLKGKIEEFALYVGRISEEKGVFDLLDKWSSIDLLLKVVGPGAISSQKNVEFLGSKSQSEVLGLMQEAKFLIFPSLWFEGMPLVLLEAMKTGLPVIATDFGGRSDLIKHGWNGFLYDPKEEESLVRFASILKSDKKVLQKMSLNMKALYRKKFAEEIDYLKLRDIYEGIIE